MRREKLGRTLAVGMLFGLVAGTASAAEASLADAVMRADKPAVSALLADRTNINVPQSDGMTALHWAVRHDDLAAAEVLIKAGADVKASTRYGVTPVAL